MNHFTKNTSRLLFLMSCFAFTACSDSEPTSEPPISQVDTARSNLERELQPTVSSEDFSTFVSGNTAFALDLYAELANSGDANLFYSPHSISSALGMVYAGAKGETAQEMKDTLHFSLPDERLHPAFNYLDLELASREHGHTPSDEQVPFTLRVSNSLWGLQDYPYGGAFLDTLAVNYGAGLRLLDFVREPEQSRLTINSWVAEQTKQLIQDLIPQGTITTATRFVLTNTIYFYANWAAPFEPSATREADFHNLDGSTGSAALMQTQAHLSYANVGGHQVVELPYVGREVSMLVFLPEEGQFEAFESSFNGETYASLVAQLEHGYVALELPKFELEGSYMLNEVLPDLGMNLAFSPDDADFSGITSAEDLFISKVIHRGVIKVDEHGTEAAAATAVIVDTASPIPIVDTHIRVDRPFLFAIRDIPTGAILFVGRVTELN